MKRGKFITLEGGEGAGKSTQAKQLAQFLRKQGIEVVLTREVGGAPGAEQIRKLWLDPGDNFWDPLSELFLIFAARREHLTKTILPALKRGNWVISDRFMDSTRAYQSKSGPIEKLYNDIAGAFEPDLTLLLDVPVDVSMARVDLRGGWHDRYQLKPAAFHRALRTTFLRLAQKYSDRIMIIDASKDTKTVSRAIEAVVRERFEVGDDPRKRSR